MLALFALNEDRYQMCIAASDDDLIELITDTKQSIKDTKSFSYQVSGKTISNLEAYLWDIDASWVKNIEELYRKH